MRCLWRLQQDSPGQAEYPAEYRALRWRRYHRRYENWSEKASDVLHTPRSLYGIFSRRRRFTTVDQEHA
jgi:hypothetical protein